MIRNIAYLNSKTDQKSALLTPEIYAQMVASDEVTNLCQNIAQASTDEQRQQLKGRLKAVIWMAEQPADGSRPKRDTARSNGLCFHDLDHLAQPPLEVYQQHIKPHIDLLGIALVKVSARGEGLHIVSLLPQGWTPAQTQQWLAETCGLSQYRDAAVKDLSRLCYVTSKPMHLYYNKARLWDAEAQLCPQVTPPSPVQQGADPQGTLPLILEQPKAPAIPDMYDAEVSYAELVPKVIELLGGVPRTIGGRHDMFCKMASALALTMDYQPDIVMHYLRPYQQRADFDPQRPFGNAELQAIVTYACRQKTFRRCRQVEQALKEIGVEHQRQAALQAAAQTADTAPDDADTEVDDPDRILEQITQRPLTMPRLPALLKTLVSIAPERYRPTLAMCAMSPLMALADGVTYTELNGTERTLQNHTVLIGPPSSNKGSAIRQTEMLVSRLLKRDEDELLKLQENHKAVRRAQRSKRGSEVEEYEAKVRVIPPATTVSELLKLQQAVGNHSLFMYTPEISNITSACGSGSWADLRTCYREGWDGDYHGQMRSTAEAYSGRVRLRLCVLAAGTPGQAFGYRGPDGRWRNGFYGSKEDGLSSRLMLLYMPYMIAEPLVRFGHYTEQQQAEISRITAMLETETGHLEAPRLQRAIERWNNEICNVTLRVGGGLIDEFRRRCTVQALSCGYLAYLLEDHKDSKLVSDWACYCADLCLQNLLKAYIDQANCYERNMPGQHNHRPKIIDLLKALPETFTVAQFSNLRVQNGQSPNVKALLNRLQHEKMIASVSHGVYQKLS